MNPKFDGSYIDFPGWMRKKKKSDYDNYDDKNFIMQQLLQ